MTDTSKEAVARLAHQMDNLGFGDVFELIHALAAERDALKAELRETRMQAIVDFGKLQKACEERNALKAEVERLRGALLEQSMPCTCHKAHSRRGLQDPGCPAGEYGDDCRAAIGLSPLCQFNIRISALQENTDD